MVRLVTIDSVGWIPDDGVGALSSLRAKSVETATSGGKQAYEQRGARMCCGQDTIFPDLQACAVHRAKQTVAGAITVDQARVLAERGHFVATTSVTAAKALVSKTPPAIPVPRRYRLDSRCRNHADSCPPIRAVCRGSA